MRICSFVLLCISLVATCGAASSQSVDVVDLSLGKLPNNMKLNNTAAKVELFQGKPTLKVSFSVVDWPNVFFTPPSGNWNWSNFALFSIDIFNPEPKTVNVCLRVDNFGADGISNCATQTVHAKPKAWTTIKAPFTIDSKVNFWGMRGIPGGGISVDQSKIVAFQIFLPKPDEKHTLYLRNFKLIENTGALDGFKLPFVDKFGQNIYAEYPHKLKNEADWKKRIEAENKEIQSSPTVRDRDSYGGWTKGPKLAATGWFRTEKIDGKWWLVTPEGSLFFSIGIDTIHPTETTFIEGRDGWFADLPDENSGFKEAYGYMYGTHSMADTINGKGKTFAFYLANQIRKYGAKWKPVWIANVYKRLPSWGFNTIANWSDNELLQNSPMPFVGCGGVGGKHRAVEGAKGYWGYMPDVFDPEYKTSSETSLSNLAKGFANNKYCIGYFVDNELSWETIERGTLASPEDQPCRIFLVNQLKEKYGNIDELNKAWETHAKDWAGLRNPDKPTNAYKQDIDQYIYLFAKKYFVTIRDTIKKYDPNHLYLGCRFSSSHPQVVRACAHIADIVSFNIYSTKIEPDLYSGANHIGKPLIIGEFHFGALDRGMLHTGLVPTNSQAERAEAYTKYVTSVAQNPAFVGCHWFQYIDEPLTGRWFDGENYNIGFLDVTDTPYPELTEAAKKINAQVYDLHFSIGK